jgi:signal peptidase I
MLWIGRWPLALAYLLLTLLAVCGFLTLFLLGLASSKIFAGFEPDEVFAIPILIVAAIAFAHALRLRKTALERPWYSRWYIALPAYSLLGLAIAIAVHTFHYQPFNAPSASNIPTLMIGDYFFVSKTAYTKGATPQRGDMAIFKLPTDSNVDYVKRVVGMPGDRIQMIHGVLNINGAPARLEKAQLAPEFYRDGPATYYRETLPSGRSYVIANRDDDDGQADNTEVYIVPEGHYFTLGDNRDNSQDSRYLNVVGYVPEENFTGPVVFRFWNSAGFSLANRPEEIYPAK